MEGRKVRSLTFRPVALDQCVIICSINWVYAAQGKGEVHARSSRRCDVVVLDLAEDL